MPVGTPQLIRPACLTLSSVGPACAAPPNAVIAATSVSTHSFSIMFRSHSAALPYGCQRIIAAPSPATDQTRPAYAVARILDASRGRERGFVAFDDRASDDDVIRPRGDRVRAMVPSPLHAVDSRLPGGREGRPPRSAALASPA